MSHVKKVVETLGGWRPALKMVKPSTSTFVMMSVLVVLVIFFPENQWGWDDEKPSTPPREETQATSTEPAPEPSDAMSPSQPEESVTTTHAPTGETSEDPGPNEAEMSVDNAPPSPVVDDANKPHSQKPSVTVTVTEAPPQPPRREIRTEVPAVPSSSEAPAEHMNLAPDAGAELDSEI